MSLRLLLLVLAGAVFGSALGVVYAKHESRKQFVQLQRLQAIRDELDVDWGRLQLEQSTWATDGRIERIARQDLGMQIPAPGAVIIVKP
jgi:cell division protein FtsL